jgi:hypothetical protein
MAAAWSYEHFKFFGSRANSMSEFSKQHVDAWKACLRSHGFSASERRLNCISLFLLKNDFFKLDELIGTRHPSVWPGAAALLSGTVIINVEF